MSTSDKRNCTYDILNIHQWITMVNILKKYGMVCKNGFCLSKYMIKSQYPQKY